MAEITAAAVKSLRDKTQLPMMECKRALQESGGDESAAFELLRKQGKKTMEARAGRETEFGRIAVYADLAQKVGAIVEVRCESGPVAGSQDFIDLANQVAEQLATGPGASDAESLLAQPAPGNPSRTLADLKDDLSNKMREVFQVARILRIDGPCGGYAHHTGTQGALVEVEGDNAALAKEIAMHVVAMRPKAVSKDELPADLVQKEREILSEAARKEGKPENIIEKMVEGRLRNYFAEQVLAEQPFVKDDQQTVGKVAAAGGLKLKQFVFWQLGK